MSDTTDTVIPVLKVPKWQPSTYTPGDFGSILAGVASGIAIDSMIINQIAGYLSSQASAAISDVIRSSGLAQLQNDMTLLQNEYNSVKTIFTTDLNFTGGDVVDSSLNAGFDILDRAEKIVDTIEHVEEYAEDIIDHIKDVTDFVGDLPDKIAQEFENFQNTLEYLSNLDLSKGVDQLLNNLPSDIKNALLDLDIIKDPLLLYYNIKATIVTIATTIANIKLPTNLNDVRAILAQLRNILAMIKQIKARVDRIKNTIEQISKLIQSGDYLSLLMSVASGGLLFLLKPIDYAARYPYNHGYKRPDGSRHERDSTPGAPRTGWGHPSGSRGDINSDGSGTYVFKNGLQVSVDKNLDVLVKGAATITVQGEARVIGDTVTVESKGNTTVTGVNVNVMAHGQAAITAAGIASSVLVTSSGTCSINCVGTLDIGATGGISISTPSFLNITASDINIFSAIVTETLVGGALISSFGPYKINSTVIGLN